MEGNAAATGSPSPPTLVPALTFRRSSSASFRTLGPPFAVRASTRAISKTSPSMCFDWCTGSCRPTTSRASSDPGSSGLAFRVASDYRREARHRFSLAGLILLLRPCRRWFVGLLGQRQREPGAPLNAEQGEYSAARRSIHVARTLVHWLRLLGADLPNARARRDACLLGSSRDPSAVGGLPRRHDLPRTR